MEEVPDYALVTNEEGDWQALYVEGVLRIEGHTLTAKQLLEAVGVQLDERVIAGSNLDGEVFFATELLDVVFEPFDEDD